VKGLIALLLFFTLLGGSANAATIVVSDAWSRPAIGSMPGMAMSAMPMNGVSSMVPVRALPLPTNGTLVLAPGGAHIMLIGLHHDLRAGATFPVALHFARAGWIGATVHVRPI